MSGSIGKYRRGTLACAAALVVAGCTSGWTRFESADCGFSVLTPQPMKEETRLVGTSAGSLAMRWYTVMLPRDLLSAQTYVNFLQAGCGELPQTGDVVTSGREVERWLSGQLQGRVLARGRWSVGEHVGEQLEIRGRGVTFQARMVWRDRRLYLLVAGRTGLWGRGRETTFMDSFQFLAAPTEGQ